MKKKLIILIIAMIIILPVSAYAYGGINTNIVIGETNAATSSVAMTNSIVGTLQVLGTIVSVVALIIIGIRYMVSSVDQKAQLKGVMWYYIIGAMLVLCTSNVLAFIYDITEDAGHTWKVTRKEPTCTKNGSAYHECQDPWCDESYTTVIQALGHNWSGWSVKTEATCTNTMVEQRKCARCNLTETRSSGSALGHSYGEWTTKTNATCTAAKIEKHTCSRCSNEETRSSGSALGHSYGNWTTKTNATCTAAKIEKHTCSRCSNEETRSSGSALGHSYGNWTMETAATCTAAKVEKHTCSRCSTYETRRVGSKLPHSYGGWTTKTAATCTAAEVQKRTCSKCGNEETRNSGSALGHDWDWPRQGDEVLVSSATSCQSKNIYYLECMRGCGAHDAEQTFEFGSGPHNYQKSGCDEKCTVCGDIK